MFDKSISLPQFLNESALPQNISEQFKNINSFLDYIVHPTKIFTTFLIWTVDNSYLICIITASLAVVFYIVGHKKALKYVPITLTIYILLQAIGGYLK